MRLTLQGWTLQKPERLQAEGSGDGFRGNRSGMFKSHQYQNRRGAAVKVVGQEAGDDLWAVVNGAIA